MATSRNAEIKPDHVIIWLDKNMGVPENNRPSKKVLADNADVDGLPVDQDARDIDNLICSIDPELVEEEWNQLIKNPIRMFTDRNECIKCINDNIKAKRQPFLITSGQMGALIVPLVHNILPGYIYIFCAQRTLHEEWTRPYEKHIEIYDDEKGVFAKVLADIAIYYYKKSQNETSNENESSNYLQWARRLFIRASKLDHNKREDFLEMVEEAMVAPRVTQPNENDNVQ